MRVNDPRYTVERDRNSEKPYILKFNNAEVCRCYSREYAIYRANCLSWARIGKVYTRPSSGKPPMYASYCVKGVNKYLGCSRRWETLKGFREYTSVLFRLEYHEVKVI